jgi:glucose-1-phosphate adenylyltransferase
VFEEAPNREAPHIYNYGLVTIGEKTRIPSGVQIGKNVAIQGDTRPEDYPDGILPSGETLVKAGDLA